MSLMIDGELRPDWLRSETENGEFIRMDSTFRHWVTPDGAAGPSGEGGFKAEAGRYHLYLAHACPWCHRVYLYVKLKGLEHIIGTSFVHPDMLEKGWKFESYPGSDLDTLNHCDFMYQIYSMAEPKFTGIVTVPVLWDKKSKTIVNNESSEIIRMLNSVFDAFTEKKQDYYPVELRSQIDSINDKIYHRVNNGVYRCGFASNQEAYEQAFNALFATLDELELLLGQQRYLVGRRLTEADWRLLPTLLRFDPVYVGHFKCNLRRIADYPNLSNYLRELYQIPGVAETFHLEQTKRHYYYSHETINPTRIIPKGPELNYTAPHDRERLPLDTD